MSDRPDPVNPAPSTFWTVFTTLIQQGTLHQEAIADALGLNLTDLRCIGFAWTEPDLTPGRLAELTGLTTGAVTGVLDRLERAGFVQRMPDPTDRRRTFVRVSYQRGKELGVAYDPLERAVDAVMSRVDPDVLRTLTESVQQLGAAVSQDTARLRASSRGGMVGEMFTAPLGDVDRARLVVKSGAPRIAIRAAPLGLGAEARMVAELVRTSLRLDGGAEPGQLCRAMFTGSMPDISARKGDVAMTYKRRIELQGREARVGLSREVPWELEISGGLSALSGDLREVQLRDLRVAGSVDDIELRLGRPDGTSRVRIAGNTRDLIVEHPVGSALRLSVSGGAHEVHFGDEHLREMQGTLRLETPRATSAPDRFEIELSGGAGSIRIRTA